METILTVIAVIFVVILLGIFGLLTRLIVDQNNEMKSGSKVYMLKVSPNGDIKIKRYRGSVKYWNDLNA